MKLAAQGDFGDFISVAGDRNYPGYVIKGRDFKVMIDGGINLLGPLNRRSLEQILGDAGRLTHAFATHSHYDHLGTFPYLKRKIPKLKIGGAPRIGELMHKENALALMHRLSEVQRGLFREVVGDEDVRLEPITIDLPLKQGDIIDLGGISCQVFEVPGHTRDSLAYFIPELRALFAGEAIGLPGGKNGEVINVEFASSYASYLASLEKMIDLKPTLAAMAHAWVFTDQDAIAFLAASYQATFAHRKLIETYLDRANGQIDKAVELMVASEYNPDGTMQERTAYLTNLKAKISHIASLR
jgi:glyoxylase-like metal-dependent hydrolase (beta-lactamase superfamily II)